MNVQPATANQLPHPEARNKSGYIPYIDGLRGVAVLAVIIYHLNHGWLPGGFSGVDVFFVISGFVVSAAQTHRSAGSLGAFARNFYARRIRRIVPALLVCLVTVLIASAALIPASWLAATNMRTGLYAFVGLSNLVLADTATDYFSPRTEYNPFTHTWSLGVEEQFYVAFPLLFFLWAAGKSSRSRRLSSLMFAVLLISSVAAAWWLGIRNPTLAYYTIATRFWELAFGVLLCQFMILKPTLFATTPRRVRRAAVGASLFLLALGFAFARASAFPYPWAFAPVLGTAGLLAFLGAPAVENHRDWIRGALSRPTIVYLGRISYSLYLWHWPVIVLLRWTIGMESWLSYVIAVAATFTLAVASFRFVESPFRYSKIIRRQPQLVVIAGGIAAIGFSWAFSFVVARYQSRFSLSVTRDTATWNYDGLDIAHGMCPLQIIKTELEGGVRKEMRPECGPRLPGGRILMMGDSQAGRYVPVLQTLAMETGTTVIVYEKLGCSYLNLVEPTVEGLPSCRKFTTAATALMAREIRSGDVLFLSSLRLGRLGEQWANFSPDPSAAKSRAAAVEDAAGLLRPLTEKGVHVVFEAPKPIFRAPAFRCLDWFNRSNPACRPGLQMSRSYLLGYREPVMRSMSAVARKVAGVQIWDPFPILCPSDPCSAVMNGKPLFFDGDHLSGYGNRQLYPELKAYLTSLLTPHAETRIAGTTRDH